MNDIVHWLRTTERIRPGQLNRDEEWKSGVVLVSASRVSEAADEIEHLRDEIKCLRRRTDD